MSSMKVCPLISIGTGIDMVCTGEKCAWYMSSVKKCSIYLMAYESILNVKLKQKNVKK